MKARMVLTLLKKDIKRLKHDAIDNDMTVSDLVVHMFFEKEAIRQEMEEWLKLFYKGQSQDRDKRIAEIYEEKTGNPYKKIKLTPTIYLNSLTQEKGEEGKK